MSKGSKRRPTNTDKFSAGWDRAFGKADAKQAEFTCQKCGGKAVPDIVIDDSEYGYSVPTLTCEGCGDVTFNECSTEELLGA